MERGVSCGKKRVAILMPNAGIRGLCHQQKRFGWKTLPAPPDYLVKHDFAAIEPGRVKYFDITQNRTRDGGVCCAAVIEVYSRMVVGWSIGDPFAVRTGRRPFEMARWQRKPAPGTNSYSGREAQHPMDSWSPSEASRTLGFDGESRFER